MLINAKKELEILIKETGLQIKCAQSATNEKMENPINLKIGYTQNEYNNFMDSLDVAYNDLDIYNNIFGTVWFDDGSWITRTYYNGEVMWEHFTKPDIPECLTKY